MIVAAANTIRAGSINAVLQRTARAVKAARLRVLLFLCLGCSISVTAALAQSDQPTTGKATVGYNIFLTNKAENNQPLDEPINEFDCSDRIFVVIFAAGLEKGSHDLKVRWLDPIGNPREVTRFPFEAVPVTKIWAWLQLDGGTAAMVGQMFDPSFGMEEFIGDWSADVYIDEEKVSEQKFRVLC